MATRNKSKKSVVAAKKPAAKTKAKANPVEMRVAIAKDVLKQLAANKIVASQGVWLKDSKLSDLPAYANERYNKEGIKKLDVCEYVNAINKCRVCALGSIFLSSVKLYNNVYMSSTKDPEIEAANFFEDLSSSPLKRYFSANQLRYIEATFEGLDGVHHPNTFKEENYARAFHDLFPSTAERLKAIMQNIIENNGTFKPETYVNKNVEKLFSVVSVY